MTFIFASVCVGWGHSDRGAFSRLLARPTVPCVCGCSSATPLPRHARVLVWYPGGTGDSTTAWRASRFPFRCRERAFCDGYGSCHHLEEYGIAYQERRSHLGARAGVVQPIRMRAGIDVSLL